MTLRQITERAIEDNAITTTKIATNAIQAHHLSANTTSAQLAGVISDETGSGSLVFATSPTLSGTPQAPTAVAGTSNNMIATTAFVANAVSSGGISETFNPFLLAGM